MTAEAAISLLLMLHLQRGFHLEVIQIAYVFLPGAVAMSILPPYLHRLVVWLGRRRMLVVGAVSSALFAAGLALAPTPPWIAALWVLSAIAWSIVIPMQRSVIAEAVGSTHLGRTWNAEQAGRKGFSLPDHAHRSDTTLLKRPHNRANTTHCVCIWVHMPYYSNRCRSIYQRCRLLKCLRVDACRIPGFRHSYVPTLR